MTDEQATTNPTNYRNESIRRTENIPIHRIGISTLFEGLTDAESMDMMKIRIAIRNTKTTNDIMSLQKQLIFDTMDSQDGKSINVQIPSIKSSVIRRILWYGNRIGTKCVECGHCRAMVITNPYY